MSKGYADDGPGQRTPGPEPQRRGKRRKRHALKRRYKSFMGLRAMAQPVRAFINRAAQCAGGWYSGRPGKMRAPPVRKHAKKRCAAPKSWIVTKARAAPSRANAFAQRPAPARGPDRPSMQSWIVTKPRPPSSCVNVFAPRLTAQPRMQSKTPRVAPKPLRLPPPITSWKPRPLRLSAPVQSQKAKPFASPLHAIIATRPPAHTRMSSKHKYATKPLRVPVIRWRIVRTAARTPDRNAKESTARLRKMQKRALRALRFFDHIQEHVVRDLMRQAAHDLFERRRQAREGVKEQLRQQRHEEEAARPSHRQRWTPMTPPEL